ncbi:hypothetical protein GCM10010168_52110 [Actinoplanes ianthinogenes]|uniref:Uncharacterized protein n=1 Tax=Actinoplanes ianthinogenes TaxID=122358 RepID=A0ABM7M3M6_9ACTN|nr:hypothetical protein [Actinoplanes ianthinogenes]BCJ46260.1 hypothetical protein Aiant_69170 [Actinoplanes ianthinogenes]GGR27439.1 hypothetical protein GCM10010168_52110 [Actinoplanes ianthinogenes]
MTQRRSIRTALLGLILAAAFLMAAAALASPAQASAKGFHKVPYNSAAISTTKPRAATVTTVTGRGAATAATPLVGFCTFDGYDGVTSYIGCSIVGPATVYVYCSNGNIFYGYLPAAGVYSLTARPCYATGYSLV